MLIEGCIVGTSIFRFNNLSVYIYVLTCHNKKKKSDTSNKSVHARERTFHEKPYDLLMEEVSHRSRHKIKSRLRLHLPLYCQKYIMKKFGAPVAFYLDQQVDYANSDGGAN